jgi:beta-phosphoglucomutase
VNKIKAVIFDLDGVLVDATEWHYIALNKALALFGYTITREEHEKAYNGLPTKKKLLLLSEQKKLPLSLHPIINTMKQKYSLELIQTNCAPDFQKLFLLKKLKARGYKLAVCSNAIYASIEIMLKRTRLWDFFDEILSNQEVTNPKPDPEIYNRALAKLQLQPQECIIVEDAEPGIKAARASGAWCLEVSGYNAVCYDLVKNFIEKIEGGPQSC